MKISTLKGATSLYRNAANLPNEDIIQITNLTSKLLRTITAIVIRYIRLSIKNIFFSRSTLASFAFAYLFDVVPRLTNRIFYLVTHFEFREIPKEVTRILIAPFDATHFPVFVARLIATLNTFAPLCKQFISNFVEQDDSEVGFAGIFMAGFLSAMLNFPRFQKEKLKHDRYYTLDWTLILLTRMIETLVVTGTHSSKRFNIWKPIAEHGDVWLFIIANYIVMDTWVFKPWKLTPEYRQWISKASNLDEDITEGLRYIQQDKIDYSTGKQQVDSTNEHFMKLCVKYKRDIELGDISKQPKLPCTIFHQFRTDSCLMNSLVQFKYEFKFAFRIYTFLNLFAYVFIRRFRGSIKRLVWNSIRSSMFLGTASLIRWWTFCFIRNYHPPIQSQRFWDLAAIKLSNLLSGLSILVESHHRRKELSMFVIPKALGTFVDPTVNDFNIKIEIVAFSLSFATLIAFARTNPSRLRGLVGRALSYAIKN
ncbi:uncharacterized protein SPAPADRAFT_137802 [Spathaspora passalidarum NRRL Y-27907]|uniref:Transmembrane protein 135 N-terminal domain-containing protein n=1 Tax=Spathaspora passalidarum (strain NRRL Y-27907 / 11-Y1) TaxID=619300 RepID=G3AM18_SPAPN|nr:uncharacterized protein SPAPADRAFT_137802 [Spathaspora passalidarum NRRL Y-27907]EGW33371.1 hypothetical protein SPAPADRAFT_137802 [Spathaspora passalidarum NRRL Y-27907]